eukprot:Gb_07920 [translate_table: standard]
MICNCKHLCKDVAFFSHAGPDAFQEGHHNNTGIIRQHEKPNIFFNNLSILMSEEVVNNWSKWAEAICQKKSYKSKGMEETRTRSLPKLFPIKEIWKALLFSRNTMHNQSTIVMDNVKERIRKFLRQTRGRQHSSGRVDHWKEQEEKTFPTYLQSITVRLEEWRIKQTDTEEWMQHRQLPPELRQCIRRYDQYKWVATRGVDEEALLQNLPMDLRRDIKRHLCLDLVRRVPLFDQMDERMLDAICERLKPALSTEGTFLVREGDPVNEMLFIIRGHLDSCTTNGGRTGFFNSSMIGPGDFCGEELLTWALDPKPSINLPSSTRTVKALVEVEAFALRAEDLKFVASQFRRLHSKQLQHTFRFYSHQWRTWAACFIQAAWRRFKRRILAELRLQENSHLEEATTTTNGEAIPTLGVTIYASRFAANTRRGAQKLRSSDSQDMRDSMSTLRKPTEPDFTADDEEEI